MEGWPEAVKRDLTGPHFKDDQGEGHASQMDANFLSLQENEPKGLSENSFAKTRFAYK